MLFEDGIARSSLDGIIGGLTPDLSLRADLQQEAMVHLWRLEQQIPGQTVSWYLKSCQFHVQHVLASGKSVDAHKRRSSQMQAADWPGEQPPSESPCQSGEAVLDEVSAREMTSLLMGRLGPRQREILRKFAEGYTTIEISLQLGLSHQAISKHRRSIATMAKKLGIRPPVELVNYRKRTRPIAV